MKLEKREKNYNGIHLEIKEEDRIIARSTLYLMTNELHEKPFGFVEDVWVDEAYRRKGLGSRLYQEMINLAKEKGCYKILACSRLSRKNVHDFIEKNGFGKWGYEFRIDLK